MSRTESALPHRKANAEPASVALVKLRRNGNLQEASSHDRTSRRCFLPRIVNAFLPVAPATRRLWRRVPG